MNDTKPVVEGSTQATHWTCPQAPANATGDNTTHHLTYPNNVCAYCKVSRPDLVARHEELLKGLTMASISIKRGETTEHIYSAPTNVLDVTVAGLKRSGMQGLLAVAVASKALKLYTHGKAELGYGLTAHIEGQKPDWTLTPREQP